MPPQRRNLNRLLFLPRPRGPAAHTGRRGRPEDRAATAAHIVSGLRAAAARYPDDPDLAAPAARPARAARAEFAELWETEQAGTWRSHRKRVDHPTLGPLVLDCDTLHVPDSDQAVIVYSAEPGTPEAEALALLRVLGTQSMEPSEP